MYKSQYDHGVAEYQSKIEIDPIALPVDFTAAQPSGIDPNKRLSDLTVDEKLILTTFSNARKFAQVVLTMTPGDMNGNSLSSTNYLPLEQLSAVSVTTDSTPLWAAEDVSTAVEMISGLQPYKPKMIQIANTGSYGIFLGFGLNAVIDQGFYVPAGGQLVFTGLDIPKCDTYAIGSGGTTKVTIGLI